MPCLRRANALNYTDNDEDAEKLLSFLEEADAAEPDGEWVATHMGRCKPSRCPQLTAATQSQEVAEIPDSPGLSAQTAGLNIGEDDPIPDMDEIPDMDDEGLEEAEDDAVVRPAK